MDFVKVGSIFIFIFYFKYYMFFLDTSILNKKSVLEILSIKIESSDLWNNNNNY